MAVTVCNLPIPAAAAGAERHKGVQSGPAARHVELHKCCVRAISTQLLASRLHRSPKKRNRLPRSRLRRPHRSSSEIKVIPALHTTLNSGRIYHLEGVGYGRIVGVLQQPRVPKLLQERLVLRAKGVGTVAVDTAARPWVLDEDRPAVGTLVDWCTQGC